MSNQKSLFDDLMKTGDVKLTNCELIKLDPMLVELEEASGKLLEVTKGDERKQVVDKLQAERGSVSKLKIAIKEWLDAQDRDDQSVRSLKSNNSQGKSAICLTIELIGVQSRLENKVTMFEQLLRTNDSSLVHQEFKMLESILMEMKEMSRSLEEALSQDEKAKVKEIVEKAEIQVQEIGGCVKEFLLDYNEDQMVQEIRRSKGVGIGSEASSASGVSRQSKRSRSPGQKSEVSVLQAKGRNKGLEVEWEAGVLRRKIVDDEASGMNSGTKHYKSPSSKPEGSVSQVRGRSHGHVLNEDNITNSKTYLRDINDISNQDAVP